jgi:uncharacterized protein
MVDRAGGEAGDFSLWVAGMRAALRGERPAEVPCGSCTACCTSSQFVHIGPDETDALARIPAELLVPAPGMPRGHVVLGYDERGHCPMLVHGRCSVYQHRPRACRTYDCRVFAAAGVEPDQPEVAVRVRGWRFAYAEPVDRGWHGAMRAFAREHRRSTGATPVEAAVRAVEAVER